MHTNGSAISGTRSLWQSYTRHTRARFSIGREDRRCAFTLVELLVVITIITVLIAVLLPALDKARQASNTLKCLSQLRVIGQATQEYVADNNGYLFPCYYQAWAPANAPATGLQDILASYLPSNDGYLAGTTSTWGAQPTVWFCPDAININQSQFPLSYACNQGPHPTYGYNTTTNAVQVWVDDTVTPNVWHNTLRKISSIRRSSEIVSIADASLTSNAYTCGGWFTYTDTGTGEMWQTGNETEPVVQLGGPTGWANNDNVPNCYHMRWRHNNNRYGNAVFLDGHADTFGVNDLLCRNFAVMY